MTRSQESCLAKVFFLPLQARFGLHGSCLKSKENKRLERIGPRTSNSEVKKVTTRITIRNAIIFSSSVLLQNSCHYSISFCQHLTACKPIGCVAILTTKYRTISVTGDEWPFVFSQKRLQWCFVSLATVVSESRVANGSPIASEASRTFFIFCGKANKNKRKQTGTYSRDRVNAIPHILLFYSTN